MFYHARTFFAVMGLLLLSVSSILADANGATTETDRVHKITSTSVEEFPCIGSVFEDTITQSSVFRLTTPPNGGSHFSGTITGKFEAVPLEDPSLPTYTGHFASTFTVNRNSQTETIMQNVTVIAKGSDGSTVRFQIKEHLTQVGDDIIVKIDEVRCS